MWLKERGVIGDFSRDCVRCFEGRLTLKKDSSYGRDGFIWRCTKKECGYKVSVRAGSWFKNFHLTLKKIVKLTYYWVHKIRPETVRRELRINCEETVVDWFNFCREVCSEVIENENVKIGGPGKTVEKDESKFGKRKYHKGRRKEGAWVFGGIERESKNCFLTSVPDRSAETLIAKIKKHVFPGTNIISDCWKAYSRLAEEGYAVCNFFIIKVKNFNQLKVYFGGKSIKNESLCCLFFVLNVGVSTRSRRNKIQYGDCLQLLNGDCAAAKRRIE